MTKLGLASTIIIAAASLALAAAPPVGADEQKPYRVRGSLEAVQGDQLTVRTDDGQTLDAKLTDNTRVMVVVPASLDDIKQGDYVGLTSIEAGDKRVAIEAHIFAEDLRGTAEGHGPWDLVKEPNTMTNATVAEVEDVGDQRELKVELQAGSGRAEDRRQPDHLRAPGSLGGAHGEGAGPVGPGTGQGRFRGRPRRGRRQPHCARGDRRRRGRLTAAVRRSRDAGRSLRSQPGRRSAAEHPVIALDRPQQACSVGVHSLSLKSSSSFSWIASKTRPSSQWALAMTTS